MKYIFAYGLCSGAVIIATLIAGLTFGGPGSIFETLWFGYLVMLVALAFVFVGLKRYRDVECGGVIGILPALGVGLGIAVVATLTYVLVWEAYLAATGYAFMDQYVAGQLRNLREHRIGGAELAAKMAELNAMRDMYANPLLRMAITASEIAIVAVPVAVLSALALIFPKVLPARGVAPARSSG